MKPSESLVGDLLGLGVLLALLLVVYAWLLLAEERSRRRERLQRRFDRQHPDRCIVCNSEPKCRCMHE